MSLTILDLVVLGAVALSALLAAVRGFTREVLSIASWVAAAVAAWSFHPLLLSFVKQHVKQDTIALVIAIAAIFLVTLVIVSLITARISDFVLDSRIGALDRTLGLAFGAARGLLLAVVGYLLWTTLVPETRQPDWVRDAKTKPLLESSGKTLLTMLPQDIDTSFIKGLAPRTTAPTEAPAEEPRPPAQVQPQRRSEAPGAQVDRASLQRAVDNAQRQPGQPQRP
ncbi:MAG: CvpA family protein [Hyphomicrobiales bacterium]|jgi:membrane protein required for colicin V production|nr:CvpA family protein [Hyphomicrobiales bacterium]